MHPLLYLVLKILCSYFWPALYSQRNVLVGNKINKGAELQARTNMGLERVSVCVPAAVIFHPNILFNPSAGKTFRSGGRSHMTFFRSAVSGYLSMQRYEAAPISGKLITLSST